MSEGYITLSRKLLSDPWWGEHEFSPAQAWIDLLFRAAHKPTRRRLGSFEITLARGQFVAPLRGLTADWKWGGKKGTSTKRVRTFLDQAEALGRIAVAGKTPRGDVVYSIPRYDEYQLPAGRRPKRVRTTTGDAEKGAQVGHSEKGTAEGHSPDQAGPVAPQQVSLPLDGEGAQPQGTARITEKGTPTIKEEGNTIAKAIEPSARGGHDASDQRDSSVPDMALDAPRAALQVVAGGDGGAATDPCVQADAGERSLHSYRSEAAGLIQQHLWLGKTPPALYGPRHSMGTELSIWNELAAAYGPEIAVAIIALVRQTTTLPATQPISLKLVHGKNANCRALLNTVLGIAQKRAERAAIRASREPGRVHISIA